LDIVAFDESGNPEIVLYHVVSHFHIDVFRKKNNYDSLLVPEGKAVFDK